MAEAAKQDKLQGYKIVVFGSGAVGKSSITLRFVSNTFASDYLPTIEDCYRKTLAIDGIVSYLDILDTAGQEDFSALRDQWVREGNAFLLVFSVTSKDSLRELAAFRERIIHHNEERETNLPMILVGNKIDLVNERKVTREEALATARQFGNIPYVECSALQGTGCDDAFFEAVRACRKLESKNGGRGDRRGKGGGGGGAGGAAKEEKGLFSWCTIL